MTSKKTRISCSITREQREMIIRLSDIVQLDKPGNYLGCFIEIICESETEMRSMFSAFLQRKIQSSMAAAAITEGTDADDSPN